MRLEVPCRAERKRPSRMRLKPFIFRALVAAAIGLVTTVAVAWAMVFWSSWDNPRIAGAALAPDGSNSASVEVMQAWQRGRVLRLVRPADSQASRQRIELPPSEHDLEILQRREVDASWGLARQALRLQKAEVAGIEEARGWPFVVLYSYALESEERPSERHGGLRVSDDPAGFDYRFLPYFPVWRGIFASAALYGLPWLILMTVPSLLRGKFRSARGLCPRCGYDLRVSELAVCPECGRKRSTPLHSQDG